MKRVVTAELMLTVWQAFANTIGSLMKMADTVAKRAAECVDRQKLEKPKILNYQKLAVQKTQAKKLQS